MVQLEACIPRARSKIAKHLSHITFVLPTDKLTANRLRIVSVRFVLQMTGLPPGFRLNLTGVRKNLNQSDEQGQDQPKLPPPDFLVADLKKGATVQPNPRPSAQGASRQSTTLARKNLVIQSSDSDSDLDLDLESVPVGKEVPEEQKEQPLDVVEAPMIQVSNLPEFDADDDDFGGQGEGNKFAILQDLLLAQEDAEEPPDEWSYRKFIKQFANSEASQENVSDGDDEEDGDYEIDSDEEDDYE